MDLYTIGFTKKSAYRFFEALRDAGVERVVDVRLNNVSQLVPQQITFAPQIRPWRRRPTGPMLHRTGPDRPNAPSDRSGKAQAGAGQAGERYQTRY
jgi:hypothetical protein